MFFQKNISEILRLGRRLRVSISTCYITSSFFTSAFTFYLSTIIFIDHAHWRSVYHITTLIWASYSAFSRSHTLIDWPVKSRWGGGEKAERAKWRPTQRCVLQTCYRASICWLHHRPTSIDVVDSEDQSIGEDRGGGVKSCVLQASHCLSTQ